MRAWQLAAALAGSRQALDALLRDERLTPYLGGADRWRNSSGREPGGGCARYCPRIWLLLSSAIRPSACHPEALQPTGQGRGRRRQILQKFCVVIWIGSAPTIARQPCPGWP